MNLKKITPFISIPFMVIGINSFLSSSALAEGLKPGNIIIAPDICVNTTGGTCTSGTIIVDDGTCKRNVVVQSSVITTTGDEKIDARSTKIVSIGGCVPDDSVSTATVIVNPQIMVTPKSPTRTIPPTRVTPVTPVNPNDVMPRNMPR
jgi:hypothetical protein